MNKKKLKIAIFHLAFIYSGGGERLVLEQARGLTKLGHQVEIFTSVVNKHRCFPDIIEKFDIKTFLPQLPLITRGREPPHILLTCALAPFFAYKFKDYQVILAANQPSPWIAWWVNKLFGVPYVSYLAQPTRFLYPREVDNQTGLIFTKRASQSFSTKLMKLARRFITWADKISIQGSNIILANGQYIKEVLEKVYQVEAVSCPAGAHPVPRWLGQKRRYQGEVKINRRRIKKPYLLITNRHFPQKRFEYAVSTLSAILKNYPEISLVITGEETDYTSEVKVLVKRLSLNSRVKFLGLVKEKDLQKLYSHAAVYLYTAPEEDFGMGIIEAMAQGTPVVAWNNAGPTGIIEENKTGFLAQPFEVADFTNKIMQILTREKLTERLGGEGRKKVIAKFSYNNHLNILEDSLNSLVF